MSNQKSPSNHFRVTVRNGGQVQACHVVYAPNGADEAKRVAWRAEMNARREWNGLDFEITPIQDLNCCSFACCSEGERC